MYQNKLVVAIKSNGKILRETGDLVHLPFGSEFSILVKNLDSRRAEFSLHIDGTDVLDGHKIIVNANSDTEIKRFIRNGNMSEGNAFKFIERTRAIEDGPRGVKIDDGIVRVEFWFEQPQPSVFHGYTEYYGKGVQWQQNRPIYGTTSTTRGIGGSSLLGGNAVNAVNAVASNASYSADSAITTQAEANLNDVGITVPGSRVDQAFTTVYGFRPETQSHVIVLRMAGMVGEVLVSKPVTVKTSQKCITCGKVNKSSAKFCSDCGTALTLL